MNSKINVLTCGFLTLAVFAQVQPVGAAPADARPPNSSVKQSAPSLPPPPAGVTDLKFSEFFVSPIGARGLTFTDKLRRLEGNRVRVLGYMVRQGKSSPGTFLLAPIPVQLDEDHYGLADDLPAATLYVSVAGHQEQMISYTPRPMLLTGILSLGNREEPDGHISAVRLVLDAPVSGARTEFSPSEKGAERLFRLSHGNQNAARKL